MSYQEDERVYRREESCDEEIERLKNISEKFEKIFDSLLQKDQVFAVKDSFVYFSDSIISAFEKIKESGKSIDFMNLYKGVPIINRAKIVNIVDGQVTFKVDNPLQEIAMKLDGKAFILKNEDIARYIKADVVYVNFPANTIVLENFTYLLNMPATQREYIRVYPDIVAKVVLKKDSEVSVEGRLYDLSQAGLGVVSENNSGISNNEEVLIKFKLKEEESIKVKGRIVNVIEYDNAYRYCVRIFPNIQQVDKITQYIENRKNEILEDLKHELKEYLCK